MKKGLKHICDQCLAGGALVERGLVMNEGDIGATHDQLATLHPDSSADVIEAIARQLGAEVSQRTPHPSTWQHFFWPAYCGDYCRYEREVGKPGLLVLADDRDVLTYIADSLYDRDHTEAYAQTIWDNIRPDSPTSIEPAYDMGVYLFLCLTCDQYILLWDAD